MKWKNAPPTFPAPHVSIQQWFPVVIAVPRIDVIYSSFDIFGKGAMGTHEGGKDSSILGRGAFWFSNSGPTCKRKNVQGDEDPSEGI